MVSLLATAQDLILLLFLLHVRRWTLGLWRANARIHNYSLRFRSNAWSPARDAKL